MTMSKPLKWLIIVVLVAGGCGLFFFTRMYREDIKELKGFLAAYDRFDKALSASTDLGRTDGPRQAREALAELQTAAAMRLSSLIKNDGELMALAREIAELAEKEVQSREGSSGEEPIAQKEKRKAALARFLEMAGTNGRDGR